MKAVVVALSLLGSAMGDLYMQNPRGSNNRLNEANTNRNNDNRLFDSQNNAKGGYCYGPPMYFYEGSKLEVEWTSQHGCNNAKLKCNMVVQYMCTTDQQGLDLSIRDGTTTNTATTQVGDDPQYGMHEPLTHYTTCANRQANMGLYVADRVTTGGLPATNRQATRTRQNNGGNRSGYECAEERDYYPYWHPSPWMDAAVLTDDISQCDYYQKNSQNVLAKNYCSPQGLENNEATCNSQGKQWLSQPAWGLAKPECLPNPFGRDNHLGNGMNGYNNNYNWTVPNHADIRKALNTALGWPLGDSSTVLSCALRLRYNISSSDISFDTDYTSNGQASKLTNDPQVVLNSANTPDTNNAQGEYTLAIDTSQFARTFQDRSYVFKIQPRPDGVLSSARIFNLNVRGKRGNIVQTYPATEYDFVPPELAARTGDYIHFQWTGCDTNPAGNAGEGTDQTDRSNMVQIANLGSVMPCTETQIATKADGCSTPLFETADLRNLMSSIGQTNCLSYAQLLAKNNNNQGQVEQDVQNCGKLNAGGPYFDGGILLMNTTGTFHYMNTRNNNFSNRGQKGTIYVDPLLPVWGIAVVSVAALVTGGAGATAGAMFYAKSHPHSAIAERLASFQG